MTLAGSPSIRHLLRRAGAESCEERVVVDDTFVTTQSADSIVSFNEALAQICSQHKESTGGRFRSPARFKKSRIDEGYASAFLARDMLFLAWRFRFCNSRTVSVLASHEKFRAIVPDLANRPRQLVFLTSIDSKLNDFLNEIHQIARMERIDEDLDLHAKKKKLLRLIDEQFLAAPHRSLYRLSFPDAARLVRRLQRPARPVVVRRVDDAQTLARRSGVG